MYKKLRWWVVMTGTGLLGIIALQVYWVTELYKENKKRFREDIENIMGGVAIKTLTHTANVVNDTGTIMSDQLAEAVGGVVHDVSTKGYVVNKKNVRVSIGNNIDVLPDSIKQKLVHLDTRQNSYSLLQLNPWDSVRQAEKLRKYALLVDTELLKHKINVWHELAIVGDNDNILYCTGDRNSFENAANKTYLNDLFYNSENERFQLAYALPGFFILNRMLLVLIISGILILGCSFSFSYLVSNVFRQKKLSDIRNDFINNMTHELKTPVTSVSVALELLEEDKDLKENKNYKIAREELKRLNFIVDKVLKVASFEKNEIEILREPVVCKDWLEHIVKQTEPLLKQKNASIHLNITPENMVLTVDKSHMTNVVHNLLDNALKYNDKPNPGIEIIANEDMGNSIIYVRDNGIGIAAGYLDKIFDNFFRVPSGDIHNVKGYGLGLSYVKSVIDMHKGRISVTSMEGDGTMFTLCLPKTKLYA